jgi:hypothetical protein
MKKRSDPTTRELFELGQVTWLRFLRVWVPRPDRVRAIDSNLSTVMAEADKVLWVDGPEPWIEHVEFHAGRDVNLPGRVVCRDVAKQHPDLSLAVRLFGVGVRYVQKNNGRILLELVREERSMLRELVGLGERDA